MLKGCLLCPGALAWWDQGHMLIAGVAKYWLLNPELHNLPWSPEHGQWAYNKLSSLLGAWNAEFPEYIGIVSGSVWADHIKCNEKSQECSGTHFDGIELFNESHYIDIAYNGSMRNSELERYYLDALHRKGNAADMLQMIDRSLTNTHSGSRFSVNLLLRLFLHVFGDVHQPLHAIDYKNSTCYPAGDRGGNLIPIRLDTKQSQGGAPNFGIIRNMHALWDSGGLLFPHSYPAYTPEVAEAEASILARDVPIDTPLTFPKSIEQSYLLANLVYQGVFNGGKCPSVQDPVVVDDHYLQLVQNITRRQIAQAGLSLAVYLEAFANNIDDALVSTSTGHLWAIVGGGSTAVAILVALVWYCNGGSNKTPQARNLAIPSYMDYGTFDGKKLKKESTSTSENASMKDKWDEPLLDSKITVEKSCVLYQSADDRLSHHFV